MLATIDPVGRVCHSLGTSLPRIIRRAQLSRVGTDLVAATGDAGVSLQRDGYRDNIIAILRLDHPFKRYGTLHRG